MLGSSYWGPGTGLALWGDMKFVKVIVLSVVVVQIVACGKANNKAAKPYTVSQTSNVGANPTLGSDLAETWVGNGDTLTLSTTGQITSGLCQNPGQITSLVKAKSCGAGVDTCGSLTMNVQPVTNGATGCLPTGVTTCSYTASQANDNDQQSMAFICNGTTFSYTIAD